MTRTALLCTVLLAMAGLTSVAAADPLTGAAQRFFSLEPGGSAPAAPEEFGGSRCGNHGSGAWWGRFAGGRPAMSSVGRDSGTLVHSAEGCFPDRASCRAWLSALATRYNARPIHNHCRAGYEPGAPVPPWWSARSRD
jgi:hypothetical protein